MNNINVWTRQCEKCYAWFNGTEIEIYCEDCTIDQVKPYIQKDEPENEATIN